MVLKSKVLISVFAASLFFLFGFSLGDNVLYYFDIINLSSDNAVNDDTKLFSDVAPYDDGVNQSLFNFTNTDPNASTITETCSGDGDLLTVASLDNLRAGSAFSQTATPHNLSEENNADVPFQVTTGFSVDTYNPGSTNGLNPDKYLGIIFDIQRVKTVDYAVDKISIDDLKVGIHVNFRDNDTPPDNSFINTLNPVPIPFTVWIFGAGLVGLVGIRRKLNRT